MKNQLKDIRSVRNWISRLEEAGSADGPITFFTLSSLTKDKIAEIIRDHYLDDNNPNMPVWMRTHYAEHPHPIWGGDADDERLISIILFMIDHVIVAKYFARKSYDKVSSAVTVSSSILKYNLETVGQEIVPANSSIFRSG